MHHLLALGVLGHPAPPGVFNVLGWKAPVLLGQAFHLLALGFKFLSVFAVLLLLWRAGGVELWKMVSILAIGIIAIPSFSAKIPHYASDVTKGHAVGSTGASPGVIALMTVLFLLAFFMLVLRSRRESEE